MKKLWVLLLTLPLMVCFGCATIAETADGMNTIHCPELGFTTAADASYPWRYEEDNGIVIYTETEGYIPYVIVWQGEDLIAEPGEYIHEQYTPYMQEEYGSNLVGYVEYEFYDIGGKQLPAGLYTYKVQGTRVEMLRLYDSTGKHTVAYTAKYIQGEGEDTLAALDTAIRNYKDESDPADVVGSSGPSDVPAKSKSDTSSLKESIESKLSDAADTDSSPEIPPQSDTNTEAQQTAPSTAQNDARSFELTPITWDGVGLGKVAVPDGYEMSTEVHCSDETTCLGSPIRVSVNLASYDEPAILTFSATETYFERVSTNYPSILKHVDGQLDKQTMIFMKRYQDAAAYCDDLAANMMYPGTWYKDEDTSALNERLAPYRTEYINMVYSGMAQYGITVHWCDVTTAQRVYTCDINGEPWAMCVLAIVRGYEIEALKNEVSRQWDVPASYMMLCPLTNYQKMHDEVFLPFVENTAISDQFIKLSDDLTNQLTQQVINAMNMAVARSSAYAAAMSALTTASVNSYLQSSNYSSVNRFTDYIFDQNTYTTSDGYDVSVSTSYDYVWENSNGSVGYSNSAFDMPYGATQLYPTR